MNNRRVSLVWMGFVPFTSETHLFFQKAAYVPDPTRLSCGIARSPFDQLESDALELKWGTFCCTEGLILLGPVHGRFLQILFWKSKVLQRLRVGDHCRRVFQFGCLLFWWVDTFADFLFLRAWFLPKLKANGSRKGGGGSTTGSSFK